MTQNLRVMAYNILFGGDTSGQDRIGLIADQVNEVQPDLLALCECWGFLENGGARRDAFCNAVGMHGAFVTAPSGNHVGLLCRPPWTPAATSVVAAPMYHGLVSMPVTSAGGHRITIHATHFNPYSSLLRLMEAQIVFSRTRPGEPTIVMGDFNTLPPATARTCAFAACLMSASGQIPRSAGTSRRQALSTSTRATASPHPPIQPRWSLSPTTSWAASASTTSWRAGTSPGPAPAPAS